MGVNVSSTLINAQSGTINISNTGFDGWNAVNGTINNYGNIHIGDLGNIGEDGMYLEFITFVNTGNIFVNNVGQYGLELDRNSALFTNTGNITMGNIKINAYI